jgi:hypothetical protein
MSLQGRLTVALLCPRFSSASLFSQDTERPWTKGDLVVNRWLHVVQKL